MTTRISWWPGLTGAETPTSAAGTLTPSAVTRSMALELGPKGILVNALAPGSVLTEGTKQLFYGEDGSFRAQMAGFMEHLPLGRPAHVEEIAEAILFLSAPQNSYMTGHLMMVDGGWTAGYMF